MSREELKNTEWNGSSLAVDFGQILEEITRQANAIAKRYYRNDPKKQMEYQLMTATMIGNVCRKIKGDEYDESDITDWQTYRRAGDKTGSKR